MAKVTTTLFGDLALLTNIAQVPVVETLSYLTDSTENEDGSENHIQLRSKPRQEFSYDLKVNSKNDADAFNTLWGALRSKWAIPVWTDIQFVGNVTLDVTFIECDVNFFDLRESSLALLFDLCNNYQLIEISTLTPFGINLSTSAKAFKHAYLVPVRIGIIRGNVAKPTNGFEGKVNVSYMVEDTKLFDPPIPDQYLSNDVYLNTPVPDGEFSDHNIINRQDLIDFELGKFEQRSPWLKSKVVKNFRSVMFTRNDILAFKNFFNRRLGKFRPFWMPSFENNIRITSTSTIVSTFTAYKDSYIAYMLGRVHVAFQAEGIWYIRVLSSPTSLDENTMQYTLSSPLNIEPKKISRACYLGLYRLDTDIAEINYTAPNLAECNLSIVEIDV